MNHINRLLFLEQDFQYYSNLHSLIQLYEKLRYILIMGKLLNISCFSIKCHASDCEFDWFIMIYHLSYVLYNRETWGLIMWIK
jgi:hypothetical protein